MINPLADQYEAWSFGGTTPDMPNILADLVRTGQKTATASAYAFYQFEDSPLPRVGDYNIILDSDEEAVCITKTTKVYTTPFCDVSDTHAFKEGEGDKSLAFWRDSHEHFFARELQEIGLTFTPDMIVVCEEFEVVYPVK
ncbi:MAG: ASCH domain-containing protein [Lachnospiraceae bacterium]